MQKHETATAMEVDSLGRASDSTTNKKTVVMAIIPAYNESKNIRRTIQETMNHVKYVIVVDDGSQDNTAEIAMLMNAKVIRNTHNMGKGAALKQGFVECSKYNDLDVIITLDGDGQHDPTHIPQLLKPIENDDADIVIGSRYKQESEIPKYRRIGLSIINKVNQFLLKTTIKDTQSGFRAYKRDTLSIISRYNSKGYGVETEQLAIAESSDLRIVEVPINIKYLGLVGISKQNAVMHGTRILLTIFKIAFESRPSLFFGLAGVILFGIGIIAALYVIITFNMTGYFSTQYGLITLGLVTIGSILGISFLDLPKLNRFRGRYEVPLILSEKVSREKKEIL